LLGIIEGGGGNYRVYKKTSSSNIFCFIGSWYV